MLTGEDTGTREGEKPWHRLWPKDVPKHIEYPRVSLSDLLTISVRKHPDRTALVYFDNKITFGKLDRLSNRFARALTGLGLRKGDRVALLLPNTPQFIVAFYGAIKCGAIVTSLSPLDKGRELEHQLVDSGAETIVALDIFYPTLSEIAGRTGLKWVIVTGLSEYMPRTKSLLGTVLGRIPSQRVEPGANILRFQDLIKRCGEDPYTTAIDPSNDVAVLQYTGGTTGTPKGVMLTHLNLVSNTIMCAKWLGTESDASYLSVLPFFHIYGLMTGLFAPLYIGAKVVLYPRFDSGEVLQAIERYGIQVFCGVPTMYNKLLGDPELGKHKYSSLKYCMSGADPLHPELKEKFAEAFGTVLVEGYGLSEASPITHSNPLHPTKVKGGSIGIPWPDTEARIVDQESGETTLPPGEFGELVVRGPQVMKGYWNRSEETASVLRDGWLYTGDLGRMDEDGYFYLIDRKKDLIKYKGHSVYPRELEEVLYGHPAVKSCSVIGVPSPAVGEVPKAFVVLSEGATASEQELMSYVNDRVAHYKAVREIEFRAELPTNIVGKVLKRELRARAERV